MKLQPLDSMRLTIAGVVVAIAAACVVLALADASALPVGAVFVILIVVSSFSNIRWYRRLDFAAAAAGCVAYGILEGSGGGGITTWVVAAVCLVGVAAVVRLLALRVTTLETEQEQMKAMLDDLTIHDEASGLMKRRYGELAIQDEVLRARRTGAPLTLVLAAHDPVPEHSIDLAPDEDEEAAAVGALFRDSLRATDRLARLSVTRFVAILPATDAAGGAVVAGKLGRVGLERGLRPLRFGVATFPDNAVSAADLLEEALAALELARSGDMEGASPGMLA